MRRVTLAAVLAVTLALVVGQTAFGAHAVRHHGSGLLKGTWDIDFDSGTFNTTVDSTDDMQFHIVGSNNSMRYLETESGTAFAKMGMSRPSYSTCFSTMLHSGSYALSNVPVGTWFCFHTNANRIARFRLDQKHPYPGGVNLTYTTWV